MSQSTLTKYTVQAADLIRDQRTIFEIWSNTLSDTKKLAEKFEWQFLNNPYGKGRCWLLLASGREVGSTGMGIRPIYTDDRVFTAGVACDLCVDREHRFLLPALLLQKALIGAVDEALPVVYGLPNLDGTATVKRVGYTQAGLVHRYAKILRVSSYSKVYPNLRLLIQGLGGAFDLAAAASDAIRNRVGRDQVVEIGSFDERFDELWQRSRGDHDVICVRDSRFLQWRYGQCPLQDYKTLGLLSRDQSRLLAYVVFYMQDEHMMCADLFAGNQSDYSLMLAAAAAHARRLGAISMSIHCSPYAPVLSSLQRLGFRCRTVDSPKAAHLRPRALMAYAGSSSQTVLKRPWYFTPGDEPYN